MKSGGHKENNMEQTIVILHANAYNFKDDSGKLLQGVSCHYLLTDDLSPQIISETEKGIKITKESLKPDKISKIVHVPGVYKAIFRMQAVSNGSPRLKIDDIDFVETLFQ